MPPDAPLTYTIKLISINGVTDRAARRADIDDEQRYSEDAAGNVYNAAEF